MTKTKSLVIVLLALAAGPVGAGSLDAPAAPSDAASAMFTLEDIYQKVNMQGTNVVKRTGAFTEPVDTNASMHTLNDVMALVTNRAPVQKTGMTAVYGPNDDGTYRIGVTWPTNRFTAQSTNTPGLPDDRTNCILDNLTGLMWTKNANIAKNTGWSTDGLVTWTNAINVITNGSTGLVNCVNYGGYSDWRLPNIRELESLLDWGKGYPPLPAGNPFVNHLHEGGTSDNYWSSTTCKRYTNRAWYLSGYVGSMWFKTKGSTPTDTGPVWPVRGGIR